MFGVVYRGRCRGQDVAIKELKNFNSELKEEFIAEVEIMSNIPCPNIVQLLGACTEGNNWTMVTEFMHGGDLHHLLHTSKKVISINRKIQIAIDICSGMAWLSGEDMKIIHRDLKPANVLLDANYKCKIADFGLALLKSKGVIKGDDNGGGSPLWMSPEALLEEPTTVKTDVYSFGLVFWEILTQKDLFPEYNDLDIFTQDIARKGVRPSLEGCNTVLSEIIKRCWHKDPNVRPHFKELITILQNARVDINLPLELCPTANSMWKSKFIDRNKVEFEPLMKQLFTTCGEADSENKKNVVALILWPDAPIKDRANKFITLGKLAKLIKWFGKLKAEVSMLARMENIARQKWFFGNFSADKSEKTIRGLAPGTFLVRLNVGGGEAIENAPFTITALDNHSSFLHIRCYPSKKGGYYIKVDNKQTRALGEITDFILHLKKDKIICITDCEGSPFEAVFTKVVRQTAYNTQTNHAESSEEDDV